MMVNMAFGQTELLAFYSWGVAPGYGDGWPSAKRTHQLSVCYRPNCDRTFDRIGGKENGARQALIRITAEEPERGCDED